MFEDALTAENALLYFRNTTSVRRIGTAKANSKQSSRRNKLLFWNGTYVTQNFSILATDKE